MLRELAAAAPAERGGLLISYLSSQLIRILALGATYQLDPRRSLVEMGMDSLMAMELRNRLQTSLNVRVPVSDLMQGPSAEQLSAQLLRGMGLGEPDEDVAVL